MRKANRRGRRTRKLLDLVTYAAVAVCVLVFSMGVHDAMSGTAPAGPEPIPFNSYVFFGLLLGPPLLSLGFSAFSYFVQMYRLSSGTRNRGWEVVE